MDIRILGKLLKMFKGLFLLSSLYYDFNTLRVLTFYSVDTLQFEIMLINVVTLSEVDITGIKKNQVGGISYTVTQLVLRHYYDC